MKAVSNRDSRREVSSLVRKGLIKKLMDNGIKDERVLGALNDVPREQFIEAGLVNFAYQDQPLPIGYGQTISQPYIVAYMTQVLLAGREVNKVLEIGTGSGYQTAVLARIIPRVFTIERIRSLSLESKSALKSLGYNNIHFRCADGCKGWEEFAPYDAIIVTAAAERIPTRLLDQLASDGRMVVPLNDGRGAQDLIVVLPKGKGHSEQNLGKVRFVPLIEGGENR